MHDARGVRREINNAKDCAVGCQRGPLGRDGESIGRESVAGPEGGYCCSGVRGGVGWDEGVGGDLGEGLGGVAGDDEAGWGKGRWRDFWDRHCEGK